MNGGMRTRAVAAVLMLPGVVGYLLPYLLAGNTRSSNPGRWAGALIVGLGSAALLHCAYVFLAVGEGTLAPWSPPRHLVTTGLYRRSRNPMYVAVVVVVLGWAAWYRVLALVAYAAVVAVAFQLRIVLHEEPRLASAFGQEWAEYKSRVGRWF